MSVITFNGRNGAVSLLASDIHVALGFVPYQITSQTIREILGYTPVDESVEVVAGVGIKGGGSLVRDVALSFDTAWGDSRYLTKTNTTTYVPTGAHHPATKKYVDDTFQQVQGVTGSVISFNGRSGAVTLTLADVQSVANDSLIPDYDDRNIGSFLTNDGVVTFWSGLLDGGLFGSGRGLQGTLDMSNAEGSGNLPLI